MHQEVLNKRSRDIFSRLSHFKNFYLAGGTALALQIGHRISVDFDLFSKKPISKKLLPKVEEVFSGRKIVPSVNNPDELTVFVDAIKITFLFYPFPIIKRGIQYAGVSMLGIKEIAATKAYTIGRRGSFKDYVDLYFVIADNYATLNEIMKLANKKYGSDFNARLFLEQLIYLEDIEDTEIIVLKNPIGKDDVERFFIGEVKKLTW
jgi:hypothetical protein